MAEVIGIIEVLNLNQQVSEKYSKSEVVIKTTEKFPQEIIIEFGGQNIDLLDPYKIGEEVKIQTNLRGKKWTSKEGVDKYFLSLSGWRVERLGTAEPQQPIVKEAPTFGNLDDESDIPF